MKDLKLYNIPLDINFKEFQKIANTLHCSYQAMISKNKMIYFFELSARKIFGFDEILELDKIKEHSTKKDFYLIKIY